MEEQEKEKQDRLKKIYLEMFGDNRTEAEKERENIEFLRELASRFEQGTISEISVLHELNHYFQRVHPRFTEAVKLLTPEQFKIANNLMNEITLRQEEREAAKKENAPRREWLEMLPQTGLAPFPDKRRESIMDHFNQMAKEHALVPQVGRGPFPEENPQVSWGKSLREMRMDKSLPKLNSAAPFSTKKQWT